LFHSIFEINPRIHLSGFHSRTVSDVRKRNYIRPGYIWRRIKTCLSCQSPFVASFTYQLLRFLIIMNNQQLWMTMYFMCRLPLYRVLEKGYRF
jgi:hypothetical protein